MAIVRLLRPHHWTKNLLVFVSLLVGHQYGDPRLLLQTCACFAAFCLLASAGYIINDWRDLADDRNNPDKRLRPLAAGQVGVGFALALAGLLAVSGLLIASALNPWVLASALAYLASTLAYSLWFKRRLMLDIVMLAGLHTVRIIAGVAVLQLAPSFWLLAFAMFIFFSLASLKRFIELRERQASELDEHSTRAWRSQDLMPVANMGISAGMLAVLVLAFYINSAEVQALYHYPAALWLLCPMMLYWMGRVWLLANRSLVHGDPIIFALRDRLSYVVGTAALLVILLAR